MIDKELREALEALAKDWDKQPFHGAFRAAFELRASLAAHPPEPAEEVLTCPRCEGQKYDKGSCSFCNNTGFVRIPKAEPAEGTGLRERVARELCRWYVNDPDDVPFEKKEPDWQKDLLEEADRILALTAPAPDGGLRERVIQTLIENQDDDDITAIADAVIADLRAQPPKETKG